jgi:hypothetical protein
MTHGCALPLWCLVATKGVKIAAVITCAFLMPYCGWPDPVRAGVMYLRIQAGPGQENDMKQAADLIKGFHPNYVMADRAYDADGCDFGC